MMISQSPTLQEIVSVSDRIALLIPAAKGEFEKEIAELKAARASLDEAQTYIGTLEESAKLRADANAYATDTRGKADAEAKGVRDAANALADAASAKASGISARETAVGAREAQVKSRSDALDTREKAIADAQTTKDAELRDREAAVKAAEASNLAASKQLAVDKKAFNDRLAALRA